MISDDTLKTYLDLLLESSQPGANIHQLILATRKPGALGLSDPQVHMYALAAVFTDDEPKDTDTFIANAILNAGTEHRKAGHQVLFAGLAQESWVLSTFDDHAKLLASQGRIGEHPNAFEATAVYAALRDGRRWIGSRALTGPLVGGSRMDVLVGRPQLLEAGPIGVQNAVLIRGLVGL